MKRVFAYLRISTNEQLTGGGFDRQAEACVAFCNAKGWSIARTFQEQESGSVEAPNRPLLSEAISLCGGTLEIDTIVVERADRIARDLIVSELFYRECRTAGIKVYAADCGEELVAADADPSRKLIRQVLGSLAEWSKGEIVKKLQAGRRRKKDLTGKPCGGPRPYGENNEDEMMGVREVLRRFKDGESSRVIAWRMNCPMQDCFPRPRGGRWTHTTVLNVIERWKHRAAAWTSPAS